MESFAEQFRPAISLRILDEALYVTMESSRSIALLIYIKMVYRLTWIKWSHDIYFKAVEIGGFCFLGLFPVVMIFSIWKSIYILLNYPFVYTFIYPQLFLLNLSQRRTEVIQNSRRTAQEAPPLIKSIYNLKKKIREWYQTLLSFPFRISDKKHETPRTGSAKLFS